MTRQQRRNQIARFWRQLGRRLVADHPAAQGVRPETVWRLGEAAGGLSAEDADWRADDRRPKGLKVERLPRGVRAAVFEELAADPGRLEAIRQVIDPYLLQIPDLDLVLDHFASGDEEARRQARSISRSTALRRRRTALERLAGMVTPEDRAILSDLLRSRAPARPTPRRRAEPKDVTIPPSIR